MLRFVSVVRRSGARFRFSNFCASAAAAVARLSPQRRRFPVHCGGCLRRCLRCCPRRQKNLFSIAAAGATFCHAAIASGMRRRGGGGGGGQSPSGATQGRRPSSVVFPFFFFLDHKSECESASFGSDLFFVGGIVICWPRCFFFFFFFHPSLWSGVDFFQWHLLLLLLLLRPLQNGAHCGCEGCMTIRGSGTAGSSIAVAADL